MASVADSAMFKTLLERMISLMMYFYVLIVVLFGRAKVVLFSIGRAECAEKLIIDGKTVPLRQIL
jgi:hypothetical protein